MIKERISAETEEINETVTKETAPRRAKVKYQLSVGEQIFQDLTEQEVRAKLLEIDPDGKMTAADYRVIETKS